MYVGLSAGYGWGQSEHTYDRNDNHGTAYQDLEGALGSVTLGYNYLVSPGFLLGVEGDLGFMDVRADDKTIFDGHVWKAQFGGLWGTVRARAGFVWDRALIYGTGGVAFMQVDEVGYGDAAGQTAWNSDFRTGWVVGGGLEYALTSKMTAKFEYLHMDFGRHNGLSENREAYTFDNTVDVVRAGVNFKF
jgi:outer membrane immunogenic protein